MPTGTGVWSGRASETRGATSSSAAAGSPRSGRAARGAGQVDPGGREVEPLDVLVEHAGRREAPDRARDRVPHQLHIAGGDALIIVLVVRGDQLLLEDPVQVLGIGPVLGSLI